MSILELKNIEKYYGAHHVVKNLNLTIQAGEFLTILGPSGCGKTTTLRMIGGFELPSKGHVILKNQDISQLPPYKRNVNTVFQHYALFPNMTVEENVAFGLKQRKMNPSDLKKRVTEMLEMVQMRGFERRKPQELSGGQQQRIAIARAVANDPDILLLDEPLGALDLKLRRQMQTELKNLHRELNKTFIYVTHDQEEALTMSDRIAVMNAGVLEQISDSQTLYYHPQTKFVADFIGEANILKGHVIGQQWMEVAGFKIPIPNTPIHIGEKVVLFIRPEHIQFHLEKGLVQGTIREMIFVGTNRKYIVLLPDGTEITATETTMFPMLFAPQQTVWLHWDTTKTTIFES